MHKEITRRFLFVLPLMTALLFMAGATALGQSTATLQGTVTDQKGNKGSDEIDIFVETEEGGGES